MKNALYFFRGRTLKLFNYLQKILKQSLVHDAFAFFLDCGTGKTPLAIKWMKRKFGGRNIKLMVLCPVSIIESVWEKELNKWWPQANVINLRKASEHDMNAGRGEIESPEIYLINYESFKKFQYLRCDGIILDESQKIKDSRSQISRLLRRIKDNFRYRIILTGSPAPNTPMEYWSQMNFVDENVLEKNFYHFRNKYFYSPHRFIWVCTTASKKSMMKKIRQRSVFLSKDECLDLPDEIFVERLFDLDGTSKEIYKNLVNDYIAKFSGNTVIAQSELV